MPYFFATSSVPAGLPPISDTTSHTGNALQRVQMFLTECALTGHADLHGISPVHCGDGLLVFQDDVAERGVRRGHMIEAIGLAHVVVQRTAHDQPHHHFYAF